MKNHIKFLCVSVLAINFGCQSPNPVIPTKAKENVKARVDNGIITGIVIGVVTPKGSSYYSYGVKSYETKEPVDEHTIFEIGSNTKTFTGLLLANEVVKGELSLDDPLQKLLPEGITAPKRNGQEIKLINLANHTSSLPRVPGNLNRNHPNGPYAELTIEQVYKYLNNCELTYDIGTKWAYSNFGKGLLGTVLAEKYETDYESLVIKEITEPLGMNDTRITYTPDMKKRKAKGHSMGVEIGDYHLPAIAGCGALRSTAVDMIKYLKANMGLVKIDLYPAMQLAHISTGAGNGKISTGLGWLISNIEGEEVIWHDGGTQGQMSFMGFNKSRNIGVVVLTNDTGFPDDIGFHLLNPKSELANPKPTVAAKINRILKYEGIEPALKAFENIKNNQSETYDFSSTGFIRVGYNYIKNNELEKALFVFKINVESNPEDWNANDSYAEALLKNGEEEKAIEYYQKSVELNPENTNGIAILKQLGMEVE